MPNMRLLGKKVLGYKIVCIWHGIMEKSKNSKANKMQ